MHGFAVAGAKAEQSLVLLHDYRVVAGLAAGITIFHGQNAQKQYLRFLNNVRPYSSLDFRARMHVTYSRGWL
jgi:hypothetical protein